LPWDELNKATYTNWTAGYDLKTIQQLASQRLENDNTFKLIKESSEWLSKQNDKQYSLQLDKYRQDQKMVRTTIKQLESLLKLSTANQIDVTALPAETNRWADDKNKQDRFAQWLKSLREDIYLDQAVKVMNDMIGQQNLVKGKTTEEPAKKAF
jgi:carboxyl-terminal processing protease